MTLKYKNYAGSIQLDQDAGIFHGEILGIVDVVTFEGRTADEVLQAFKDSVDDYLEFCDQRGEEPDKAFSGRLVVRMPPSLHREAAIAAQACGISLNSWIVGCVQRGLSQQAIIDADATVGVVLKSSPAEFAEPAKIRRE